VFPEIIRSAIVVVVVVVIVVVVTVIVIELSFEAGVAFFRHDFPFFVVRYDQVVPVVYGSADGLQLSVETGGEGIPSGVSFGAAESFRSLGRHRRRVGVGQVGHFQALFHDESRSTVGFERFGSRFFLPRFVLLFVGRRRYYGGVGFGILAVVAAIVIVVTVVMAVVSSIAPGNSAIIAVVVVIVVVTVVFVRRRFFYRIVRRRSDESVSNPNRRFGKTENICEAFRRRRLPGVRRPFFGDDCSDPGFFGFKTKIPATIARVQTEPHVLAGLAFESGRPFRLILNLGL
jgi:hypothetical protein